jgi:uncharacterized repeat protein (TIGR01451 family)
VLARSATHYKLRNVLKSSSTRLLRVALVLLLCLSRSVIAQILTLPISVIEGAGTITNKGNLMLGVVASSNVNFALRSSDPTSLAVPANVTVAAGTSNTLFNLIVGDNLTVDGDRYVTLLATNTQFPLLSNRVQVLENDPDHIRFGPFPSLTDTNSGLGVMLTAENADGSVQTNFNLSLRIVAESLDGWLPLEPTNTGAFNQGRAYWGFRVAAIGRAVKLRSLEYPGQSDGFNVTPPPFYSSTQQVADIAWHAASKTLFATVPGNGGEYSNRVVAIDPVSGMVTNSYPIGLDPGRIELSPQGDYAYIELSDGRMLQRFDSTTRLARPPFDLGSDSTSFRFAYDFCVPPGMPDSVVVEVRAQDTLGNTARAGIFRYDSGLPTPLPNFYATGGWRLEALSSAFDVTVAPPLVRGNVTSGAILATAPDFRGREVSFRDGQLFDDFGNYYSASSLALLGTYPGVLDQIYYAALPEVNPDLRRVFYLAGPFLFGSGVSSLRIYDRDLMQPLLQMSLPPMSAAPTRFIRVGTNLLAYVTGNNQLWLVRPDAVQPSAAPADLSLSTSGLPSVAVAGENFGFSLIVSNRGPGVASTLQVTNALPPNTVVAQALSSQGSVTLTSGGFSWKVSPLPAGSNATLQLTLKFISAGWQTNTAWALGYEADPVFTNNQVTLPLYVQLPGTTLGVFSVNFGSEDLVYDPVRDRLVLSVGAGLGFGQTNGLAVFNPYNGLTESFAPLGKRPAKLARSDSGQYLYVSLPDDGLVRRLDFPSLSQKLEFQLGGEDIFGTWYPYYAAELAAVPGSPGSMVAWRVRRAGPMAQEYGAGLALFQDGAMAPNVTEPGGIWKLAFDSDSKTLFGFNSGDLRRCSLDSNGISFVEVYPSFYSAGTDLKYSRGQFFTSSGRTIETNPFRLAWQFAGTGNAALVEPDAASGRVFYLLQDNGWQLGAYDSRSCRRLGTVSIPKLTGTPSSLTRFGTNGLAFRTSSNQVFVIRTPLVQPEAAANLNLHLSGPTGPIPLDSNAVFSMTLSNQGPSQATAVGITNSFAPGATFVSANSSVGTWITNGATLVWILNSLQSGDQASLSYVIRAGQAGLLTVTAAAGFPGVSLGSNTAVQTVLVGPPMALDSVAVLRLQANDLVWSPSLGRLLLTSSSNNPNWGGALLTLDPVDLSVGFSTFLGVDAGRLSLSEDDRLLYTGVDGGVTVSALPSLTLTNRFLITPIQPNGSAADLKVVPGANNAVMVASRNGYSTFVSGYDFGVQRTNLDSFQSVGVSLQFGEDPSLLYCAGDVFRRYSVGPQGVDLLGADSTLLPPATAVNLVWGSGRIYTSIGRVIDPNSRTLIGSFAGIPSGSRVVYDAASARVFYLCPGASQATLRTFDAPSLLPIGSQVVSGISGNLGPMVRWGADGFAVITSGGQVLVFRSSLVPTNPPADLSVSLAHSAPPYLAGTNITATIVLSNAGPNVATDVAWKDLLPIGVTVLAANSSTGTVLIASNTVSGAVELLPPAATATVNITFAASSAGIISNQVTAVSSSLDANFRNNSSAVLLWIQPPSGIASVTLLPLPVKDIESDPLRPLLYASLGAGAGALADSVIAVDPINGSIGAPVRVGSDPGKLAASADGQALYVALDGAGTVQKLGLPDLLPLSSFPVPNNQSVVRMMVSPIDRDMVVLRRSPDGRTSLHVAGSRWPGELLAENLFAFSTLTGQLFGCDGFHSNVKLYRLDTGPAGLQLLEDQPGKPSSANDLKSSGGLLFFDRGMVVDPQTGRVRAVMPVPFNSLVEPDVTVGRVFYLTPAGSTWTLRAFDIQQGIEVGSLTLPQLASAPRRLVRWGPDGLALFNTNSQVLILRGQLVPTNSPTDLAIRQTANSTSATTNDTMSVSLQLTNLGSVMASGVVVTQTFSLPVTDVVLSASLGTASFSNAVAVWRPGDLAGRAAASLTVSFRPAQPGGLSIAASATHGENDPFWGNNVALNAITVSNPAAPGILQIRLACRDLVYDQKREVLYASTPATSGLGGNLIAVLNPGNGILERAFAAGSEPNKLAIPEDSEFLYAALDGAMGVRRFNLDSNTADLSFPFTTNDIDYAIDLQVRPGYPRTVAASVGSYNSASPYPSDVMLYDDGTQRMLKGGPARGLAFAGDGAYLFGSVSPGYGNGLVRMSPGPDGFTTDIVPAFSVTPTNLKCDNGRVYSDSGDVVDPYAPAWIGSLAASGPQAIDSAIGRAFYLAQRGAGWELRGFDLSTLQLVGTQTVAGVQGSPRSLVRCGSNRLAFCTTSNQLFIINSPLVPTDSVAPANLALSQTSFQDFAATAETLRFTIEVHNQGPGAATNVLLAINPPAPVASLSLDLPQTSFTNSGTGYLCDLGRLGPGQALVVRLSAVITNTGTFTNFVSVSAATPDPDLTDNTSWAVLPGHFFQRTDSVRIFDVSTRALAYDPGRRLLVAALVSPTNQIAWFDVESGSLQGTLPIGINPDKMLVTQDSDYLYLATIDAGLVQRVYLPSRVVDLSFAPPGALNVGSMALLPGSPHSVAVTFYGTNGVLTALFDDSTGRPNQVVGMPYSLMCFDTDGAALYGYANTGTGGNSPDVFRMSVSAAGLALLDNGPSDTPYGIQYRMDYAQGRLFFEDGRVLNPVSWTLEPSFALPNWGSGMSVMGALDRAAFLTADFNNPFLAHVNTFAIADRQQLAQVDIRTASPGYGHLVWCGEDRFAFRTPTEIVFVRSSTIPIPTNLGPVSLTLSKDYPGDPARLKIQSAPGYWYSVESSADLLQWNQVTNFFGSTAITQVMDSNAQASGARYYRAIRW